MKVIRKEYAVKSPFMANCYGLLLASCGLFFGVGIGTFNTFFVHFIKNFSLFSEDEEKDVAKYLDFFYMLGGALACPVGSAIYERFGRYRSILFMLCGELLVLGGMYYQNLWALYGLRFGAGFFGCFATFVATLMIKETLPEYLEKRYNPLFGAFLTCGIFLGYCFQSSWTVRLWRVPLMWPLVPEALKLALFVFAFRMESPKWLYDRKRGEGAIAANYRHLYSEADAVDVAREFVAENDAQTHDTTTFFGLFARKTRTQLFLAILLNVMNQLTGINILMFSSTDIFKRMRLPRAPLLTMGLGLLNFCGCLLLTQLLKRFSQKTLMAWGIFGQALGYSVAIGALVFNVRPLIPLGPYIYILSFGCSLGGLLYSYCAHLVPAHAISICALFQWVFTCVIVWFGKDITRGYDFALVFFVLQLLTTVGGILFVGFAIDTTGKEPPEILAEFEHKKFFH